MTYFASNQQGLDLKNLKRSPNIWKGSNVVLDTQAMTATSYDWWYFVKRVNGKIVFNDYRYSISTAKHQRKVRSVLAALGIKIDLVVELKESLNKLGIAELTVKQLKAESDRQCACRAAQRKARAKANRVAKRIESLGLYTKDGQALTGWAAKREAQSLCGVEA